jgi:two-component system chemotaxis sensor kinase CheA
MAIIDGMVVKCGTERYVVPLAHVHESVSPKTEDLKTLTGIGDVLMLRGENIPAVRLAHLLGRKSSAASNEMIAIIVRTGVKPFALMVDDIIGQYQVVTKQLGEEIQYLNGFAGSTILGDGRPALIIEPIDLFSQSSKTSSRQEIRRAS